MNPPELVTIRAGLSQLDAGALQLRLERAGIYCHLANEYTARFNRATMGGIWLQVPDTEVERANAVLAQESDVLPEIDMAVLEEAADEGDRCPECGSDAVEYASSPSNGILGICQTCGYQWNLD